MKIARFLFIKRQDCLLFNVIPHRMFKQRRKYRRSVHIAFGRYSNKKITVENSAVVVRFLRGAKTKV
jgi:hypothetical protein